MSDQAEISESVVPEWEREPITLEEAIGMLNGEAYEIEDQQRRFAAWKDPRLTAPSPTAMRRAVVLRYVTTVLQIVYQNDEEFKKMIRQKRDKVSRLTALRRG